MLPGESKQAGSQPRLDRNLPVVFIGPMAAGKSSIGLRTAKLLGGRFVDSDQVIVGRHGSISELFATRGEAVFRDIEAAVVRELLAEHTCDPRSAPQPRTVIALGGGAVLHPDTQALLQAVPVVLLMTTEQAVRTRASVANRPLLANDPGAWSRILRERLPIYERLASITIDTSRLPKDQLARQVVRWLEPDAEHSDAPPARSGKPLEIIE